MASSGIVFFLGLFACASVLDARLGDGNELTRSMHGGNTKMGDTPEMLPWITGADGRMNSGPEVSEPAGGRGSGGSGGRGPGGSGGKGPGGSGGKGPGGSGGKGPGGSGGLGKVPQSGQSDKNEHIIINVNNGGMAPKHPKGKEQFCCPEGFELLFGECYLISKFETSRSEAMRFCMAMNSNLISLEGPGSTYRMKFLMHETEMNTHNFWTSGFEMGDKYFWEAGSCDKSFDMWRPEADITDSEKMQWAKEMQKDVTLPGPMDYIQRKQFSGRSQCILLGPDQQGSLTWRKESCLNYQANFVCQLRGHPKRSQEAGSDESASFEDDLNVESEPYEPSHTSSVEFYSYDDV